MLQDVTFHQAVNLGRYNAEKVVSFVPPDGEFELMKYRCQDGISSPFNVLSVITEQGRTRVEVRRWCQGIETAVDEGVSDQGGVELLCVKCCVACNAWFCYHCHFLRVHADPRRSR